MSEPTAETMDPELEAPEEEEEEEVEEPDDAVAAATAFVTYAATAQGNANDPAMDDPDGNANNKWSKNGYGAAVDKQTGKFNKEESVLVRSAIEEYCNAKQISVSRLCSECDHKAELKGAWMEIAKRLPHRSVQSVYRHGIRQCHPFKRGAWSEQECISLTDHVTRLGKKWSNIQAKLNRSADSCRDKYREMSDEFVKGRWKEEETTTLKRLIHEHLNTQTGGATNEIEDMKELGKLVEEGNIQIPWSIISKRMGKRSRLSCFKKWQKMTGLFSTTTIDADKDKPLNNDGIRKAEGGDAEGETTNAKRLKTETTTTAPTTAVAVAVDATTASAAELAAETVEALELPDTDALATATTTVSTATV